MNEKTFGIVLGVGLAIIILLIGMAITIFLIYYYKPEFICELCNECDTCFKNCFRVLPN